MDKPREHYLNLSLDNIVEEADGIIYTEEWRNVVGYEGLYKISSFGRILTNGNRYNGNKKAILSLRKDKDGYVVVNLYKSNKMKTVKVHRLVCAAFISNTEDKPLVNHKEGIRWDNRIEKLEWCTSSENMQHKYKVLGCTTCNFPKMVGKDNPKSKGVRCVTLGLDFGSIRQAAIALGTYSEKITKHLTGSISHCDGMYFIYK